MRLNLSTFPAAIQTIDPADTWLFVRFGQLQQAIDLTEQLISEAESAHATDMAAMDAWLEEDWVRPRIEMEEGLWFIKDRFPQVLRRALFLSCYTEIESYLNRLCHKAREIKNLPVPFNELRGSGIMRAKTYLAKVAEIDFPSQSREWQALADHQHLRNVLTHTEGRIKHVPDTKRIQRYVQDHPLLGLDSLRDITIQRGFCEEVIDNALALFFQLPFALREAASCDWLEERYGSSFS